MTQNWDSIKQKIEKFATNAADKASEFTRDAAEKAEKLTKQSKIKLDIYQLEKSKEQEYLKLGKILYENIDEEEFSSLKNNQEVSKILQKITGINENIDEKKQKLETKKQNENKPVEEN